MKPLPISEFNGFDILLVNDNPYMFTNMRIDRESLPEGFVAYDVRDECDGEFLEIKPYVLINHWGTIIGINPIPLDSFNSYYCREHDGCFTGDYLTLDSFKEKYNDMLA